MSSDTAREAVVNECKSVTLKHLEDSFGRDSVISLILHGSVARNRERYSYLDGKPYLESDIDLVAIIKRIDIIKYIRSYRSLTEKITQDLRTKFLLSEVSLVVVTEKRLQHAKPSVFFQEFRSSGKVIFGKDVISLLPIYRHNQIPVRELVRIIFSNMVRLLERFVNSEIRRETQDQSDYSSVLRSLEKMTSILVRVVLIREGIPVNPFNSDEIRIRHKEHLENTELLGLLLETYEDIQRVIYSQNPCSRDDLKKYWANIVNLFSSTLVVLTGNKEVISNPSEKMLFGDSVRLVRRLHLALYVSPRFYGSNTLGDLGKAMALIVLLGPDYSYLHLYRLFLKIPLLLGTDYEANLEAMKNLWLKSFEKYFKIWNLSSCTFADSF
jgi:hypothetical protein